MYQRETQLHAIAAILLTLTPFVATAATMTGSLYLGIPSSGASRHAFRVDSSVATTGTGTDRTIILPADRWLMSGTNQVFFPGFPGVAQLTEVFVTSHGAATFAPGGGAGDVSWCPQSSPCSGFTAGTVAQGFIGYTPGPNTFGGAFRLLRHLKNGSGAYFVFNPGTATRTKVVEFNANMQGVARTSMFLAAVTSGGETILTNNDPWPGGLTGGATVIDDNPVNLVYGNSFLRPNGSVQTLGPLNAQAHVGRALCATAGKDLESALAAYAEARRLDVGVVEAYAVPARNGPLGPYLSERLVSAVRKISPEVSISAWYSAVYLGLRRSRTFGFST